MPSPFPGMDPYLESPEWFPDLHHGLIYLIKETLQQSLPEPYFAQSVPRVWLEYSQRHIDPDVPLDLQGVFNRAYDGGPYRREITYGKDPIIPRLNPEQAEWATALLATRNRRPRVPDR